MAAEKVDYAAIDKGDKDLKKGIMKSMGGVFLFSLSLVRRTLQEEEEGVQLRRLRH